MTFKYRLEEKVLGPKSNVYNFLKNNKDFELAIDSKEGANTVKRKPKQEEGGLLARVADEIRTPINGIMETVDLLKEDNLTEEQLVKINSIASHSNHLLDIINALLEYKELTSGKEKFENIDFNFHGIIRDTVYLCSTLITNNNVTLELDLDTEIPQIIKGDPSKLSQILLTLLGNSIKQIDEGSILLKIRPRSQRGNFLVLDFEIRDMDKEVCTKDLKPPAKDIGIGFVMAEGILEMLNGSLATMATLNDGCTYKFSIPYEKTKQVVGHGNHYTNNRDLGWKPIRNSDENLTSFSKEKEAWEVCLNNILKECMGEIDLLEELIGLFKQNMLDFIGRANVYIPEGNFNGLAFAAHKVKTGLSMMKADYLFFLVDKITIGCKTHRNLPEIGRLYDQLLLAYPKVEKAIDTELMILKRKGN